MHTNSDRTPFQRAAVAAGPAFAVLAAWLLSLPDDRVASGVTLANVALLIAVITVAASAVDWLAGVTTSVAAALSLNYFHTEPYHTLRISDRRDVYSVVLLGLLGLAVSAITGARVRRGVTAVRHSDAQRASDQLAELLASPRPVSEAWGSTIGSAAADLGLVSAHVTHRSPADLPIVRRAAIVDEDDNDLVLPAAGAALRLQQRHAEGRWLILTPRADVAPLRVDRRAVFAFADTVELALEPAPTPV
jgi:hypothetical protein